MSQPVDGPGRSEPRILRFSDIPLTAWKNGAGVTRELYVSSHVTASTPFDWRVSIADIVTDGPFSSFPDIDRTLLLLEGSGMTLTVDDESHEIHPGVPFEFSGDRATTCRLHSGTTRDLNVMVRRGRSIATFGLKTVAGACTVFGAGATTVIAVALKGRFMATTGNGPLLLGPLDSIRLDGNATGSRGSGLDAVPPSDLTLVGEGTVAVVHLRSFHPAPPTSIRPPT